jgi:hypothetical protein
MQERSHVASIGPVVPFASDCMGRQFVGQASFRRTLAHESGAKTPTQYVSLLAHLLTLDTRLVNSLLRFAGRGYLASPMSLMRATDETDPTLPSISKVFNVVRGPCHVEACRGKCQSPTQLTGYICGLGSAKPRHRA